MKYLFFDIEAANSYKGGSKICSFGYVLTDSNFIILEKDDIFINPKGKFKLTGRPNQKDFYLKYSEDFFRQQPNFQIQYPKIERLLSLSDCMIIGYAVLNDAKMLREETNFWDIELINFICYDAQKIFSDYSNINQRVSLELVNELLETKHSQEKEHDSLSDALLTMEITKAMCVELQISLDELIKLCPKCCIKVRNQKKQDKKYTLGERFPEMFSKLIFFKK